MAIINNKTGSRPVEMFVIERIEGKGYSVVDSKNSLTSEQKQLSLAALSETGISRPEDSPFQCFYSYNDELDKIVINYLEDGIDGNVKCRQFWFMPLVKSKPSYGSFKVFGFVSSLVIVFLLGFYKLEISNLFSKKYADPFPSPVLIKCNDPSHQEFADKTAKFKEIIFGNNDLTTEIIKFLEQEYLDISAKGKPQEIKRCFILIEDTGKPGVKKQPIDKVLVDTQRASRFLELLNHLKDF